ncbi:ArsB/NhaD family transporter, partial [Pseudomonas viridiflava]|uniref:ArsB/NhaD family transporter n=1 Tax=Pseudomonas viridiflava TaxID=33069 RepID=UPI002452B46B
ALVMLPVNMVSVMATLFMLWLCYRRDILTTYDPQQLDAPETVIRDKATFVAGWWVLALLLVGLFALEPLGIPISAVAASCALILLVIAGKGRVIS